MTEQRKRLELGELKPGQQVMVRRSVNDTRRCKPEDRYIPAVVVKASRVWVDLKSLDESRWVRTWRMRRDTQDEGTQWSGSNARFLTLEQHAWEAALDRALATLRDHRINILFGSPWQGREIELAEILEKAVPYDIEEEDGE